MAKRKHNKDDILAFLGVYKNGKADVGRLVTTGTIILSPFMKTRMQSDGAASAWDYINPWQTRTSIIGTTGTYNTGRLIAAGDAMVRAYTGMAVEKTVANGPHATYAGYGVAAGTGTKIVGRFANRYLSALPFRL